jgi:flagellar hook assembly protein FlgD
MNSHGRIAAAVALALALAFVVSATLGCGRRRDAATPEQMRARIAALEQEVPALRQRLGELIATDHRVQGMPATGVRVGVPTSLARTMIERVVTGFVDSVTLRLENLKVKKSGTVKKVVTIGQYDLAVVIAEVTGQLETGKPEVRFGGNQVAISLPVKVVSGTGNANINFKWDGKNVSGAACGDMEVNQDVAGTVKPDEYPVAGALQLTATARQILASPKFPQVKVNLKVEPSAESWAAVQAILDSKTGVCGFAVDKVNIRGVLEGLIGKGFNVRLPTEKIKPMAVPVGIAPTMKVGDETVRIDVKVSELAITEHMIWLGADVKLADPSTPPPPAAAKPAGEAAK